ncbi:MAG: hypothetical protein RIG82_07140 [Phycisphaeraceae bacterium]
MQLSNRFTTAALIAVGLTGSASAQVVTISGATLFESYFQVPANTSDFIDIDNDGVVTNFTIPSFDNVVGGAIIQQYRAVGSGNGFQELVDYGSLNGPGADWAALNALNTGSPNVVNNVSTGTSVASFSGPAIIDIATTDVPASWFVKNTAGAAYWGAAPETGGAPTPGYGSNGQLSDAVKTPQVIDQQAGGFNNDIQSLTPSGGGTALTLDGAVQDNTRIYQTPIATAPIAIISNYGAAVGAGTGQAKKSELAHLFVSGREVSGENLIALTRDSGSGTRNGAMNSLGVDPSWGVGDNVGSLNSGSSNENSTSNIDTPGPDYIPNQKQSSSRMEIAVENTRLGVGYQGVVNDAGPDSVNGRYEILSIANDIDANWDGSSYVRPVMTRNGTTAADNNIIFNSDPNTGWTVGAIQTFSTIGNPFAGTIIVSTSGVARFDDAANALAGEKVFAPVVNPVVGGFAAGDAPMADPSAALYIRNIEASIAAFVAIPGNPSTQGTPGEYLASNFALVSATDSIPDFENPAVFTNNPGTNPALQAAAILPQQNIAPAYGGVNAGNVPSRDTRGPALDGSVTYSDGALTNYVANDGTAIAYNTVLALGDINAIAGDFEGDGDRDASDIPAMVAAYQAALASNRASLPNAKQSLEIIGDFNMDGSFDVEDVRYFADGLGSQGRAGHQLDRKQNFIDVDTAFGGNLFGTTLANGSYDAGDARADVAGSGLEAAGWAPLGQDGVVDTKDIDYVFANFVGLDLDSSGGVEWSNLDEVAGKVNVDGDRVDLSADINGDLVIDASDVDEVLAILETTYGDSNLDGAVDLIDLSTLASNFGGIAGWSGGSFNGFGAVDLIDLSVLASNFGFGGPPAPAPEPASFVLLGLGALALRRGR